MTQPRRVRVLQLVDTLDLGGTERVAVELANRLPREELALYLGTTRRDGPLAERAAADVGRIRLERRGRFDLRGLLRLRRALHREAIDLVHAHSTSLFLAALAGAGRRRPALVWHDHYGAHGLAERPAWLYRPAVRSADAVITVDPGLAAWSRDRLGVPADRVVDLPNFVPMGDDADDPPPSLPGSPQDRVVCVANLRPQKDHPTLVAAFARVASARPDARLLLVGAASEAAARTLHGLAAAAGIAERVVQLGERRDVRAILRVSTVGVLASRSEGMPLALLEYGAAGLPAVATAVGRCAEVLDDGRAGLLVPPGDPDALGAALLSLLADPARRRALAAALATRVAERYSDRAVLPRLLAVYRAALARAGRLHAGRPYTGDEPRP